MNGKKPEERIGICESEIERLNESDKRQWEVIDKIQNRPPLWATTIMSFMTFLLGCSLTYIIMLMKMMRNSGN